MNNMIGNIKMREYKVDGMCGQDAYIIHNKRYFSWEDPYVVVCTYKDSIYYVNAVLCDDSHKAIKKYFESIPFEKRYWRLNQCRTTPRIKYLTLFCL